MSNQISTREFTKQTFEFVSYLNQYERENIKFIFFDRHKNSINKNDKETYGLSEDAYRQSYTNNVKINNEMIERFYNRRWKEREPLFSESDFIEDELKFLNAFHEKIKKDYETQFYPLVKKFKEKFERPNSNSKSKNKISQPAKLEDLFINTNQVDICINVLKQVEPPIISETLMFQLGVRQKGAIVAWVQVLKQRGKIKNVSDEILSGLLNKKIKGLNLSADGRSLRNTGTTAYSKYYNTLLNLIV